jgi:hypothetical protein
MKKRNRFLIWILGILGGLNILLGIFHFFLPGLLKWETELVNLAPESLGTILILNLFMGFLFIGFGILSFIYLSEIRKGVKSAWVFFMFLGVIWFIRAIMEPIYFEMVLGEIIFTIILFVIALFYLVPLIKFRKDYN